MSAPAGTPDREAARAPLEQGEARPWDAPVVNAALALGLVLMALQLWILTVALDLLLEGGEPGRLWRLAGASSGVFAGGLLVLKLLRARPRVGG